MASLSPSLLKLITSLSLTLLPILISFLLFPNPNLNPNPNPKNPSRILLQEQQQPQQQESCSSIFSLPPSSRCSFSLTHCPSSLLNYTSLHFCHLSQNPHLSLSILSLLVLLHFRLLAAAASAHFTPVVSHLAALLRLSPSMAAVTLLALGNGAPDAFASLAALRSSGNPQFSLAAVLSAGAFVSAFVVGLIAVFAAPFPLSPAPFVRDVFFYLLAASGLFYVYLSAEIYLWQAVGFVGFYVFFVGLVFWMDLGGGDSEMREEVELAVVSVEEGGRVAVKNLDRNRAFSLGMLTKVCIDPVL